MTSAQRSNDQIAPLVQGMKSLRKSGAIEPSLRFWEPKRNRHCLCGSGHKFKRCCADRWRDEEYKAAYRDHWKVGEFQKALSSLRAQVTWYRICHVRHTVPLVRSGDPLGLEILEIDIDALAAYATDVVELCLDFNAGTQIPLMLLELADAIESPRWREKVELLRAISKLGKGWDAKAALPVLRKLGDIEKLKDNELLTVALDLLGEELSFSKQLAVCRKIADTTDDPYRKLHYRAAEAAVLIAMADSQGAFERLQAGFEEISGNRKPLEEESIYEILQVINANALAFLTSGSEAYGIAALADADGALERKNLTRLGVGGLHRSRSDILVRLGRIPEAISACRAWHAAEGAQIALVFEAEAELNAGNTSRAIAILESVDVEVLESAERIDFGFVFARTALASGQIDVAERAKKLLDQSMPKGAIFQVEVAELRAALDKMLASGESLTQSISTFNRYVDFRPNIFGIGINLNAILEDVAGRIARSRKGNLAQQDVFFGKDEARTPDS